MKSLILIGISWTAFWIIFLFFFPEVVFYNSHRVSSLGKLQIQWSAERPAGFKDRKSELPRLLGRQVGNMVKFNYMVAQAFSLYIRMSELLIMPYPFYLLKNKLEAGVTLFRTSE